MQGRFTPRQLQGQALRVFEKKSSFPRFARKVYFSPKNLACRSVHANCLAFLFSFFRFFFFRGSSLFAALCTAHCAPHRRAPTATAEPPHTRTAPTTNAQRPRAWFPMAFRPDTSAEVPLDVGRAMGKAKRKPRVFLGSLVLYLRKLGNRKKGFVLRYVCVIL